MSNLAAVIVETRELDGLTRIISEHLYHLPEYTHLYIFTNKNNLNLIDYYQGNATIYDVDVKTLEQYNQLLTSPEFWLSIDEENILIFQHDSMLLRGGIEEFYDYDYVGANWYFQKWGGNGGLSFRHKSAMIKCIASGRNMPLINEDVYFSNKLKSLGLKLAPPEVNERFSVETLFKLGSMGYHAIDKYLTKEQVEQINNQYGVL
jgi:hypothetical protein